jgi:hypothetical protein
MQFQNHPDFNGYQLKNGVLHVLSAPPANPQLGRFYWDTSLGGFRIYDGAGWGLKATDSALLNGQNAGYFLNRANHTGTITADKVSDLAPVVKAYRLDEFAAPTGPVNYNSQRGINVADPVADTDMLNLRTGKQLVANAAAGIDAKASVRVVAASNIALSGVQTIDSIALAAGDRVLVRGQSTPSQNGVYIVASGAWTRATDADEASELTPGAFWFVEEGGTLGKTQWRIENTGTITPGTTSITINQFGAQIQYTGTNGISLSGTIFSVVVKPGGGLGVDATGVFADFTIMARWSTFTIGDGSATTFTLTHNYNNRRVMVQVEDAAGNVVLPDVQKPNANSVTVTFGTAPAANAFVATVIG